MPKATATLRVNRVDALEHNEARIFQTSLIIQALKINTKTNLQIPIHNHGVPH